MTQPVIAIIYHSGYGHTKVLAQAVAQGVQAEGANAVLLSVSDLESFDWDQVARAQGVVFGSPTYMGGVSAPFKAFMDASSNIWAEQGWKDKLAAGFTNSASQSGDKLNTLIQLSVFAAQHGMNWISLGLLPGNNSSQSSPEDLNRLGSFLGAMAQSNADQPADLTPPEADRKTAAVLGQRIAQAASRWNQ